MTSELLVSDGSLRGIQEPRVCTRPAFVSSAGQEAIDLGEAAGVFLDPWQQTCVHVILAEAESGNWAALEAAILVARQNGKGEILLVLELGWLFLFGDRLVMHTAHEFKTAAEAFLRIKTVIDGNDFLRRRIRQEFTSHGEEGYVLTTGQRLRFIARSRSSGRGFTGDKVILDEAQQLPSLAMDALMPTLSARPNPQIVYAGTVPKPDKDDGEFWTKVRDRGRKGKSKRLAWLEFNLGERLPAAALYEGDDPELLRMREEAWLLAAVHGNPALGFRMNWDFIEAEREALSYFGYIRERLNIWSSDPVDMVIDSDTWALMADAGSKISGRHAIAVDCPPGLVATSIAAMGYREQDAHWHAEVIDHEPGSAWAATRLGEIVRRSDGMIPVIVVDPSSPAGALIPSIKTELAPEIEAGKVELLEVSSRLHGQACGMLYARAYERDTKGAQTPTLHHLGDEILTDALRKATRRPGPEGTWLWNRRDSEDDISPLVAVTLAGYGLSTLPEEAVEPWGFWT